MPKPISLLVTLVALLSTASTKSQADWLTWFPVEHVFRLDTVSTDGAVRTHIGWGVFLPTRDGATVALTAAHVVTDSEKLSTNGHYEFEVTTGTNCDLSLCDKVVLTEPLVGFGSWVTNQERDLAFIHIDEEMVRRSENFRQLGTHKHAERGDRVYHIGRSGVWYVPTTPSTVNLFDYSSGLLIVDNISTPPGTSGAPLISETGSIHGILSKWEAGTAFVIPIETIVDELALHGILLGRPLSDSFVQLMGKNFGLELVNRWEQALSEDCDEENLCGEVWFEDVFLANFDADPEVDLLLVKGAGGFAGGNHHEQYLTIHVGRSQTEFSIESSVSETVIGARGWRNADRIEFWGHQNQIIVSGTWVGDVMASFDGPEFLASYTVCNDDGRKILVPIGVSFYDYSHEEGSSLMSDPRSFWQGTHQVSAEYLERNGISLTGSRHSSSVSWEAFHLLKSVYGDQVFEYALEVEEAGSVHFPLLSQGDLVIAVNGLYIGPGNPCEYYAEFQAYSKDIESIFYIDVSEEPLVLVREKRQTAN